MKKILGNAALMVALLGSSSVWATDVPGAEGTGNLSFLGAVSNGTCVVSGHNIAHDLGDISFDDVSAAQEWQRFTIYDDNFHVTGCPSSVTKVKIKPTATALSGGWGTWGWVANAGTAKGVALHIAGPGGNWDLSSTRTVSITKGGVTVIPVKHEIARSIEKKPDVGTLDFKIQYSFEFE
ncbi:type 1 fimbrial protein [Salmonella enterica]|nr:type 1 fimbrial protein [Salmonella enterica]